MKALSPLLVGAVLACAFHCHPNHALGGEKKVGHDLILRLLAEAPEKWQEYRALSKRLQGARKASVKLCSPGKATTYFWEDEIKQSDTAALIVRKLSEKVEQSGKAPKERQFDDEAFGQNRQYSFALSMRTAGWLLSSVNQDNPSKPVTEDPQALVEVAFIATSPHFLFMGIPLSESLKRFKEEPVFERATLLDSPRGELVRFDIGSDKQTKVKGWLIFDPNNYWCLLEYDITGADGTFSKMSMKVKNEIETTQGIPVIRKYTCVRRLDGLLGNIETREWNEEFQLRVVRGVAEREFTLSAFGLKEPMGVVWPEPTRWWLWLTGGAILVACGAFVFIKFKGRFARSEPATNPQGSTR